MTHEIITFKFCQTHNITFSENQTCPYKNDKSRQCSIIEKTILRENKEHN